jgi:2-polyprenyl-6-hydroxyphenyl methylase/3-demethylubiquinone-9 3-methyltransferase
VKNNLELYDLNAADWWNENSQFYPLYYLNQPRFEFFDRHISHWQNLKVLDVGCGGGFSCEFMAARGVIVSGLDRSHQCIAAAQKHAHESGWAIDYRQGTAEAMPYENSSFDVIVCVDVLEHVEDVSQVLSEVARVLKPNGTFFFDTINRNLKSRFVMIWLMENILGEIEKGIHDWNKFIKPEELVELLSIRGFSNFDIKGFDLFGDALRLNLSNYWRYKRTNTFKVTINDDISINYIGKATKVGTP